MQKYYLFGAVLMLVLCFALMIAATVYSQVVDGVPHLISYQGRLTDTDGDPLPDGEYPVTFSIWSDSLSTSSTDRKWISPNCTVLAVNGLFNWQLGTNENLPPWIVTNNAYLWLGVRVASDPEIYPRTRLCSAPYAYKAWQADWAGYADSAGIVVSSIGESGAFDGEVNSDMVEDSGANTIFNFTHPFTTSEKPHMFVVVVLKGSANGLVEGAAIRAAVDIKGAAGNWTGFDITVSKYSDGTSINDLSQVYVTWIAIRP